MSEYLEISWQRYLEESKNREVYFHATINSILNDTGEKDMYDHLRCNAHENLMRHLDAI